MRFLPPGSPAEVRYLLAARGTRAFADGYVAILLPVYLLQRGFEPVAVGVIATTTLLGSAALTMSVGTLAHRFGRRRLLLWASLLMVATGIGFALVDSFWLLLAIAFIGTLNPSSGDVSVFLPLEHSRLAGSISGTHRTALFARYSLIGSLSASVGSLAAGAPDALAAWGLQSSDVVRGMFFLYALIGALVMALYLRLPPRPISAEGVVDGPLGPSRRIVFRLAALFSLDAFGGGFIVQSLLALWLFQRFGLSLTEAGAFFFWTGVLASLSFLIAVPIARRIGLINTMVFTHIPSSVCLIAAAFAENLYVALALLLVRSALSQMDVPTRTSYVMAVVTPAERAAAASVTAVPRSLAAAASPALAGWLLGTASAFAWPLVLGGGLKIVYDLLLLAQFSRIRPPEEAKATTP